jgi:hypothetical protein
MNTSTDNSNLLKGQSKGASFVECPIERLEKRLNKSVRKTKDGSAGDVQNKRSK